MIKYMSGKAGSAFGGRKIIVLSLGVLLLAAACNRSTPSPDNSSNSNNQSNTTNPTPTPTPNPTPQPQSDNATIRISSNGFSPSEITVKKGTKVTFVNNDSKSRWPASDPHPTHTDLPGFDSKGIAAAGSYTFTFDKLGKWGFHDHLYPTQRGSVTVVE